MNLVAIKLTTNIDLDIQTAFKLTETIHGKTFRDAIELGALTIISEVDPEKACELKILKMEQMLAEERQALANYQLIKQIKKPEVKKQEDEAEKLEKYREEKYQENLQMFKFQAKKPHLFDWGKLQDVFRFKNRVDTEDYIKGRLKADGFMK